MCVWEGTCKCFFFFFLHRMTDLITLIQHTVELKLKEKKQCTYIPKS